MSTNNERMRILEMIEGGEITADEGARRLQQLADEEAQARDDQAAFRANPLEADASETPPPDPDIEKWRRWWQLPMWVGVGLTVFGGMLMYGALQSGAGFWFVCAWLPFLFGVAVVALAWRSRTARWLHVRIHQKPGERPARIAISFPLPIRFAAWVLRNFGDKISGLEHTGVDELILALESTMTPERPFYVDVTDDEDGERVQVFIG